MKLLVIVSMDLMGKNSAAVHKDHEVIGHCQYGFDGKK
jgi:hypothetical protein